MNKISEKIKKLCAAAMFCALAYVCVLSFRIIRIGGFLTFDAKDAVMTLGAVIFGPVSGIVMTFIVTFLEAITISTTGPWGFLMNFLSSTSFVVIASLIYKYRRRMSGLIFGLIASTFVMSAVMIFANIYITPIFMGVTRAEVIAMLPTLILPFNVIKAILNASLVLLLIKPVSTALRKSRIIPPYSGKPASKGATAAALIISSVLLGVCIALLILLLGGKFSIWK